MMRFNENAINVISEINSNWSAVRIQTNEISIVCHINYDK